MKKIVWINQKRVIATFMFEGNIIHANKHTPTSPNVHFLKFPKIVGICDVPVSHLFTLSQKLVLWINVTDKLWERVTINGFRIGKLINMIIWDAFYFQRINLPRFSMFSWTLFFHTLLKKAMRSSMHSMLQFPIIQGLFLVKLFERSHLEKIDGE